MDPETLRQTRAAAAAALAGTPVFLAYAFGSRCGGAPRPDSDLDIGYYLGQDCGRIDLPLYDQMLLEERLSRAIGIPVDIRSLRTAPLEVRGRVLEEGVRVYCSDEPARVRLECALLSNYHDEKPRMARLHRQRLAALAARRAGVNG